MADDDVTLPPDPDPGHPGAPDDPDDPDDATPHGDEPVAGEATEVAVITVPASSAVPWRRRALAVRAAVPQLARNPVVVGASAAVATVALRLAAEAAQRALGASAPSRELSVTGSIRHEVHVVRHVHVIHHVVHHYGALPPWSRFPPS